MPNQIKTTIGLPMFAILLLFGQGVASLPVAAASIERKPARCQITRDGVVRFNGRCTFLQYSGYQGAGTFAIEHRKSNRVLYANISRLFVGVIRVGVASVNATTGDGRTLNWGQASRSNRNAACWVGNSYQICAWASKRKPVVSNNDDDPASNPSYRFLYHQKMGRPYSANWYGKLLRRSSGGWTDIRIQAVGKIVYDGILQFNCASGLYTWRSATNIKRKHYAPGNQSKITAAASNVFCTSRPTSRQRASERRCAARQNYRSRAGGAGITITFINQSGAFRSIRWLDYQGREKTYASLRNGGRYTIRTGIGHPWLIADRASNCMEIHLPRTGRKTIRLLPSSR